MLIKGFPGGSDNKDSAAMQETGVRSLGWEDPLEEGMATHSSLLAWRIPWTEEPGGLQSMGVTKSQTLLSAHAHTHAHFNVYTPFLLAQIPCSIKYGNIIIINKRDSVFSS